MTMYKLTITKQEENPNYKENGAIPMSNFSYKEEPKYNEIRTLEVVLEDEEYDVIKKAVLSTFK